MFRPELSAGVELSSAKADSATTERQSMDIVIRFIFIVGRRRMAARLETELILSVVPFSIKSLTLGGRKKRMILPWSFMLCLCSAMPYVRIS